MSLRFTRLCGPVFRDDAGGAADRGSTRIPFNREASMLRTVAVSVKSSPISQHHRLTSIALGRACLHGPARGRSFSSVIRIRSPREGQSLALRRGFQGAQKFKTRYVTLGFRDAANLDDGAMWPVSFALRDLTATEEERTRALLTRAVAGPIP